MNCTINAHVEVANLSLLEAKTPSMLRGTPAMLTTYINAVQNVQIFVRGISLDIIQVFSLFKKS